MFQKIWSPRDKKKKGKQMIIIDKDYEGIKPHLYLDNCYVFDGDMILQKNTKILINLTVKGNQIVKGYQTVEGDQIVKPTVK